MQFGEVALFASKAKIFGVFFANFFLEWSDTEGACCCVEKEIFFYKNC